MLQFNINGVLRKPPEVASLINGVWREQKDIYSNINGVFRSAYKKEEKPFVCKGFLIKYWLNKFRHHFDYPKLKYNKNIPYNFRIGDPSINNFDLTPKSVVFEFNNQNYEEEGIVMYEADIYLITLANEKIDIGESPLDYRLHNHKIIINCEIIDENYGYYVAGWNSIFSDNQFIEPSGKPIITNQHHYVIPDLQVAPEYKRDKDFNGTLDIGIARDMTSPEKNMIGTRGIFTHVINQILFNGEPKPFIIEIEN